VACHESTGQRWNLHQPRRIVFSGADGLAGPPKSRSRRLGIPAHCRDNAWVSKLTFSDSVVIDRPADFIYDMVSDVTRMGEWSPVCRACWWDGGDGPHVGAWFTGRNATLERTWETRSQVVAAERGREFAFVVGGNRVRWSYTFAPVVP
jgi:hypothetical protein